MRGVRFIDRPDRPNAFGVQWAERSWDATRSKLSRKVKTLFFPTSEAREIKARELRQEIRGRMLIASLSRPEIEEYRAFKAAIGATPWQDVVAGWRSRLIETGALPCTLTVEDAAREYVAHAEALLKREKLSAGYVRHIKTKIGERFVEQFGDVLMTKVTTADVVTWIEDFDEVQSDDTFDNYKKHVRSFFAYFVDGENPRLKDNPAKRIKNRSDGVGAVGIITPAQTAQLLWTALHHVDAGGAQVFRPAIGRLALEAFVGLRFASGCRLEKKDINFADRGVLLPKHKLKTKRRHYIDGLPDCVWPWLEATPDECWDLTPRQYLRLKSDLFRVARVPHPHNCLRHNFATYHVAAFKDPGKTAYLLCHRSQDELFEHYKGNATEAAGRLYQRITPQAVEEIRQGAELLPAVEPAAPAPVLA